MPRTKAEIDRDIAAHEQALELLRRELATSSLFTDAGLADYLHGLLCHFDHADGCAYLYETWEKPGDARMRWSQVAARFRAQVTTCRIGLPWALTLLRTALDASTDPDLADRIRRHERQEP